MNRSSGRKATSHGRKTAATKTGKARKVTQPSAREGSTSKSTDEARALALLWGADERTSRAGLTVREIVRAAIAVADKESFEAVTMRRLAKLLKVGTMTLYTHIPGKSELTDLMIDAAYGEVYESIEEPQSQPGGYRAGLYFVAERNKALYARHPWLLDVLLRRPVLGPHACAKNEAELRVFDGIGLTALEMDSIKALLVLHVQGTARARVTDLRAQQADGMTELEWWLTTIPLLQRVKTRDFPVAGRVGKAVGEQLAPGPSSEHLYRFGLEMICEAVAALIARNQKRTDD